MTGNTLKTVENLYNNDFVCLHENAKYDGQHHCLGHRTQSGSLASAASNYYASPTLDTLDFSIRTYVQTERQVSNKQ